MEILLAFVSVEGLTRRVASRTAEIARESGHLVHLVDIANETLVLAEGTGAVILAAPIHAGVYPERFEALVRDWSGQLAYTQDALISVEPAARHGPSSDAAAVVARLSHTTGWVPDHLHHLIETANSAEPGPGGRFLSRLGLRRAPATDPDSVDWLSLERFVRGFLAELATS